MSARQQSNLAYRKPLRLLLLSSTACLLIMPLAARAQVSPNQLPTGGAVTSGAATISQSGNQMKVDQSSQKAIINWQGFNIGANAQVTFNQPNAAAIALNRVLSANPTTIAGKLSANGQVFLVNPAGITFANGAQVDVGGLVASTMSISDADFLAGKNLFQRNGSTSGVTNDGTLTAGPGGYIGLLAPQIRNEGVISARLGTVVLAAGEAVTLDFAGDGNVSIKVDPATVKTLIENHHLIAAPDGKVFMSAQAAGVLMGGVINNKGVIEADSLSSNGGKITLAASGNIKNTGTISADAIKNGNGGTISVVAQGTTIVGGTISARGGASGGNGGTVETSGKTVKVKSGKIDTRAPNGKTGSWTLDPTILNVVSSAGTVSGSGGTFTSSPGHSDVTNTAIQNALATTNVTLVTGGTSGDGQGSGDIFVEAPIAWSSGSTLTLNAFRNIEIDSGITKTGTGGGLVLTPNTGGAGGGLTISTAGVVTLNPDATFKLAGQTYTLVTTATQLQNINNNTDGNYALDGDINLTGVTFNPLGGTLGFTGNFEGLGHSVSYLTVGGAYGATKIGLFSDNEGTINDLRLVSVTSGGFEYVGGVAGYNGGTITNTDVSGVVYGTDGPVENAYFFGGLVGYNKGTVRNDASGVDMGGTKGFQGGENSDIGGLVGTNAGLIDSSSASGPVNHGTFAFNLGGLVGDNGYADANNSYVGTITNSYASGVVTAGVGGDVGGLVGANGAYYAINSDGTLVTNSATGNITNSFASGDVHTTMQGSNYGGVIGINYGGTITGITYTGTIETVVGGYNIGGLIGSNGFNAINGLPITPTVSGLVANVTIDSGPAQNPRAMIQTQYVGGAVGANYGTITDSQATVSIIGQGYPGSAGGLVGANYGTISNSSSAGTIAAASSILGGLVGINTVAGYKDPSNNSAHGLVGNITNSSSSVWITNAGYEAGGLVGENDGTITNSNSTGRVYGTTNGGRQLGGLVGLNQVTYADVNVANNTYVPVAGVGTITGGTASGVVQGAYEIGGAVGQNGAGALVSGVTALDYVISTNVAAPNTTNYASEIGGLVGENDGTITNGVTSGWVTGDNGATDIGGFVGWNSTSGIITNAHSNNGVTITGTAIGGLVGKNDGQIQGTGGSYSLSLGAITVGPGSQEVGGLVGENNASVSSSYAGGSLFSWGGQEIGGLIGNNTSFGLALSSFSVINIQVDGVGTGVGGLVGNNAGTIQHTQSWNPLSAGSGSSDVGGLVGLNSGSITSSLAAGNVTVANAAFNIGGLVGLNHDGTLTTDTAQGNVTAGQNAQNVGSLIGHDESGTISGSTGSGTVTAGSGSTNAGGQVGQESP